MVYITFHYWYVYIPYLHLQYVFQGAYGEVREYREPMESIYYGEYLLCTGSLWGVFTLYREPMGRSVLHTIRNPKTFQVRHIIIESSDTNSPGIINTSQKIKRLSKTRAFAYICL